MLDTSTNNKRIVKNTIFLYGRLILTMLISLYTTRVVLNALGVVDFGIYRNQELERMQVGLQANL